MLAAALVAPTVTLTTGCGARTLSDEAIDEALLEAALVNEADEATEPAAQLPPTPSASTSSGSATNDWGTFPTSALPPCMPGAPYTREDPCYFMDNRLCYATQKEACACACRRTGGNVCSSEFPSVDGLTPALVFCPQY